MGTKENEICEALAIFDAKHGDLIRTIIETSRTMVDDHDGDSLLLLRRHLEYIIGLIDVMLGVKKVRETAVEN